MTKYRKQSAPPTAYLLNIIGVLVERLGGDVRVPYDELRSHRDIGWAKEANGVLITSFPRKQNNTEE